MSMNVIQKRNFIRKLSIILVYQFVNSNKWDCIKQEIMGWKDNHFDNTYNRFSFGYILFVAE